jgi:hypothetical protein
MKAVISRVVLLNLALIVLSGCVEEVPVDVKPQSCPNPLNLKSKGVLPVAFLGTEEFDVHDVDLSTVVLAVTIDVPDSLGTADAEPTTVEPIYEMSDYEDVATPGAGPEGCDCTEAGPDGYTDLVLHFRTQAVAAAISNDLGSVANDDVVLLVVGGRLPDESWVIGADCVVIKGAERD